MPLTNNDTLRRLRYVLNLVDPQLEEIFKLSGRDLDRSGIELYMKREGEEGYEECPDGVLADFLDGLILWRRGPKPDAAAPAAAPSGKAPRSPLPGSAPRGPAARAGRLTNNDVLKKLRIALELKEDDMIEVLRRAQFMVSPSELGALFRQKGHRNYKECGDQFLRNFLTGLEGYRTFNRTPDPTRPSGR